MRYLAVCALLLLVGCGTASRFKPVTLDCVKLGMTPVSRTSERFDFRTFSVSRPSGDYWCLQSLENDGVVFGKLLLGGKLLKKAPSPEETAHTLVAMAKEVEIADEKIETGADLERFVERWLRGGAGVAVRGTKVYLDSSIVARFTLVDSNVVLREFERGQCVEFQATIEERENPRLPRAVLIQTMDNILCRHPYAQTFVLIGYSERYVKGDRSVLDDSLRRELAPFMSRLSFKPIL